MASSPSGGITANRAELIAIADSVAKEKLIDNLPRKIRDRSA